MVLLTYILVAQLDLLLTCFNVLMIQKFEKNGKYLSDVSIVINVDFNSVMIFTFVIIFLFFFLLLHTFIYSFYNQILEMK